MPKTIIQVKTFICPFCRFHRAFDNLPADNLCPEHRVLLVKSVKPEDKITLTIMGEEDIETEIEREDEERVKERKVKRTEAEKIVYRTKRKQDIVEAIAKAKLLEDK